MNTDDLLSSVSKKVTFLKERRSPELTDSELSSDEINANWRMLSRQLADKRLQIQDAVDTAGIQVSFRHKMLLKYSLLNINTLSMLLICMSYLV